MPHPPHPDPNKIPFERAVCSMCSQVIDVYPLPEVKKLYEGLPPSWRELPSPPRAIHAGCLRALIRNNDPRAYQPFLVFDSDPEAEDLSKPPVNKVPDVVDLARREVIRYTDLKQRSGEGDEDEEQ